VRVLKRKQEKTPFSLYSFFRLFVCLFRNPIFFCRVPFRSGLI